MKKLVKAEKTCITESIYRSNVSQFCFRGCFCVEIYIYIDSYTIKT